MTERNTVISHLSLAIHRQKPFIFTKHAFRIKIIGHLQIA